MSILNLVFLFEIEKGMYDMDNKTNNKYITLGNLAKLAHISRDTLSFYEKKHIIKPVFKGDNGYKYFLPEQIQDLNFIRFYRKLGFSLETIQSMMNDIDNDPGSMDHHELFSAQQKYIEKRIAELQTASKYLKREEDFLSFIESNKWYEPFTAELEEREFSLAPIRFCHSLNVIENAQKLTDFFCADGDFTIPENPVCCVIPEHVLTSDKFRAHRHNCASDDSALHKRDIFTREKGLYGCIINQGTADGIVSAVNKVLDHVSACGYAISGNAFVINSQNILNITNNQDSIYIIQIQLEKADD